MKNNNHWGKGTLKWMIILSVLLYIIALVEQCMPFKVNGSLAFEIDEATELLPITMWAPFILPWLLLLIFKNKYTTWVSITICYGSTFLVYLSSIYLKVSFDSKAVEFTFFQDFLLELNFLTQMFCFLFLSIVTVLFSLFYSPVIIYSLLATPYLSKKGYHFRFIERGIFFYLNGYTVLKNLPHHDELALLPGYGTGSAQEVCYLIFNTKNNALSSSPDRH